MNKILFQLKKGALRDIWRDEARDFTNWLAQQENLDLLSEEIGIGIKLKSIEANVGKFFVDILAEDESNGKPIIIENQLENSNHDHLGKIITYAAGHGAETIIWIVKNTREEHKKAIQWLNDITHENIRFFLIKIELWVIEGNQAPKFAILAAPNEWSKVMKKSATPNDLTKTNLQQLDFWSKFKNYALTIDPNIRLRTPLPQHWYILPIGTTRVHISLTINSRTNELGCSLILKNRNDLFLFLKKHQPEIEKQLGEIAEWKSSAKESKILITRNINDTFYDNCNDHFDWLNSKALIFRKIFCTYISNFKSSNKIE